MEPSDPRPSRAALGLSTCTPRRPWASAGLGRLHVRTHPPVTVEHVAAWRGRRDPAETGGGWQHSRSSPRTGLGGPSTPRLGRQPPSDPCQLASISEEDSASRRLSPGIFLLRYLPRHLPPPSQSGSKPFALLFTRIYFTKRFTFEVQEKLIYLLDFYTTQPVNRHRLCFPGSSCCFKHCTCSLSDRPAHLPSAPQVRQSYLQARSWAARRPRPWRGRLGRSPVASGAVWCCI